MAKLVIFTDLDGTLLGSGPNGLLRAQEVLADLAAEGIPVVFTSARTRLEILHLQSELGVRDPFISENGSAIFLPRGEAPVRNPREGRDATHHRLELGVPYVEVRACLASLPPIPGLLVQGFGDLPPEEVMAMTGLNEAAVTRALAREYDEPLLLLGSEAALSAFESEVRARGFRLTHGGTFFHLLGPTDKGRAVRVLASRFREAHGTLVTAAIGDAANDLPMLESVDHPVLIQRRPHTPGPFPQAADWFEAVWMILRASKWGEGAERPAQMNRLGPPSAEGP